MNTRSIDSKMRAEASKRETGRALILEREREQIDLKFNAKVVSL